MIIIVFIFFLIVVTFIPGSDIFNKMVVKNKVVSLLRKQLPPFIEYQIDEIKDHTNQYVIKLTLKLNSTYEENWMSNGGKLIDYKIFIDRKKRNKMAMFHETFDAVITMDPFYKVTTSSIESGIDFLMSELTPEFVKSHNRDQKLQNLGIF